MSTVSGRLNHHLLMVGASQIKFEGINQLTHRQRPWTLRTFHCGGSTTASTGTPPDTRGNASSNSSSESTRSKLRSHPQHWVRLPPPNLFDGQTQHRNTLSATASIPLVGGNEKLLPHALRAALLSRQTSNKGGFDLVPFHLSFFDESCHSIGTPTHHAHQENPAVPQSVDLPPKVL